MSYIEIIPEEDPYRVRERDGDRAYTVVGWVCTTTGKPDPILIPDTLCLGEPLPLKAEKMLPQRTYIPEGM